MRTDTNDAELFELVNTRLYTAVVGDILDRLGRTNQFLPPAIRPLVPTMRLAGRAMPSLVADVYGPQAKPFGRLTEALDQLEAGEVYIAPRTSAPVAMWGEILTATAQSRGAVGTAPTSRSRPISRRASSTVFPRRSSAPSATCSTTPASGASPEARSTWPSGPQR